MNNGKTGQPWRIPLVLILFWGSCSWAQKFPAFQTWRAKPEPWIRVGLKKPEKVVKLWSAGTLLVLDGDRVTGTLDPGGSFYLISPSQGRARHWVQIKAQTSRNALLREKENLAKRFTDLSFSIHRVRNKLNALRIGPFQARSRAEQVRQAMIVEGYRDAFLLRGKGAPRFQWVNEDFDKFDFQARDLALARLDPGKPINYSGAAYRGLLRFRLTGGKIRVINELPLETYLRGVVPSELGPKVFPELEALKAQAIAARTYVLKNLGRFAKQGYDICDGPACQAYDGTVNEDPMSDEAVRATEGLVLYYGEELIDALYTSTCGGQTEDVGNVFPGRTEPYLKGKTSYVAAYRSWDLPERPVNHVFPNQGDEHLAIECLFLGFDRIPDFSGPLSGDGLTQALRAFEWILGPPQPPTRTSSMSYQAFWRTLAALPFFKEAVAHQIRADDLARLPLPPDIPGDLQGFAGLLLRHNLSETDVVQTMAKDAPISKLEAFRWLLGLCRQLGPAPDWRRHLVESVAGSLLHVRRGTTLTEINLDRKAYYVTETGGKWSFVEKPKVEELDRVYTLKPPFSHRILRIEPSGVVASVDRFSAYDAWLEKKDIQTLEKRARQYVSKIRGIRDIRILDRSATGRVTLLEFVTDAGNFQVDGLRIRWSLGIRDNYFDMLPAYRNGRLAHATFVGRGWGHGVGMSQVGAYGLARMGWRFDQILQHYYTDVTIRPYGGPGLDAEGR